MDEKFWAELTEISASLPPEKRKRLVELCEQIAQEYNSIRSSVNELKPVFDNLRQKVKYLLFDLEATRRENRDLAKLLEDTEEELDDPET